MEPRNWFQGINSASLCSLAGRYDNPIPSRFLAPIDFLKIPAQGYHITPPPSQLQTADAHTQTYNDYLVIFLWTFLSMSVCYCQTLQTILNMGNCTFCFVLNDITQWSQRRWYLYLKGPKHEIFESGFFTQIRGLWLGDFGTGEKNGNFESWSHCLRFSPRNSYKAYDQHALNNQKISR